MKFSSDKIVLGTAQFGMPYGVANKAGVVPFNEAEKILDAAFLSGVRILDTAVSYGDSEKVLGEIGINRWIIISKLPSVPNSCNDVTGWVRRQVEDSLTRLKVEKLHGFLLHNTSDLMGPHALNIVQALNKLKNDGLVDKIGVSVYKPSEIEKSKLILRLDIVQAPLNLIDQRLVRSGILPKLVLDDTEVYIRSIFLQGLLLMDPLSRPPYFLKWKSLWEKWDRWIKKSGANAIDVCLAYCQNQSNIGKIVLGVDSVLQLKGILESLSRPVENIPDFMYLDDPMLIEPFNWNYMK